MLIPAFGLALTPLPPLRRSGEVVQQLYTLLLQLYGFERDAARLAPIRQAMAELATVCGKPAFDELAETHGPAVMEAACSGADKWVLNLGAVLCSCAPVLNCGP